MAETVARNAESYNKILLLDGRTHEHNKNVISGSEAKASITDRLCECKGEQS